MKKQKNYLENVRNQYEDLPYPPRNPKNEKNTLLETALDRLFLINQYCYNGKRDFSKGFRILIAGGGTGDGTIFLAEQLRGTPAQIVHLDLSKASIKVAKERAKIRKLTNITFKIGSLLDIANMGLDKFDYINCSGVLHHLENPDAGLKALKSVLKDDGCMGIMIYAQHGRMAVYQVQELMRLINKNQPDSTLRVENLKKTLPNLDVNHFLNHWKRVNPINDGTGVYGSAGLYDLYLHEQDRAYTIKEIYEWAEDNNLHLPTTPGHGGKQFYYLPKSYIKDPELLEEIEKLPLKDQHAIGELMNGQIIKHVFYLTQKQNTAATLEDKNLVISFLNDRSKNNYKQAVKTTSGTLTIKVNQSSYTMPTSSISAAFFKLCDGKTPLCDIFKKVSEQSNIPEEDIKNTLKAHLENLFFMAALYLHDPAIKPDMDIYDMQMRVSKHYAK